MQLILDSNVHMLYSVMAFVCAIIVLIITISSFKYLQLKNKYLKLVFYWVIFFCIQDGVWGLFASHFINNDIGLYIVSYIFHFSAIMSCMVWSLYYLSRVDLKAKFKRALIIIVITLVVGQLVALFMNFGSNYMFYVDDKGLYTTTDYRKILFYVQLSGYVVIATVSLIALFRTRKDEFKRNFLAIFFACAAPVLFGLFQMIYPDAPYDSIGFAVSCLIIHTFLTIDYEKQVVDLSKLREELNTALIEANAASEAKSTFLFSMSHDIRTPMNAITGFTTMAKKHIDDQKAVENYLDKIEIASNQLLTLINQVLEMSRIEAGKVVIAEKNTNLHNLAEVCKVVFSGQAATKSINFTVNIKKITHNNVSVDADRLEQILNNVLSNAFKYTNEGGAISLTIEETHVDDEGYAWFTFKTKDNGIGMSEEFLAHVFDEFARENTSTVSKIQGTGLGMSIVKRLTEYLNGTIDIHSQKGKGTEVILSFPFKIATDEEIKEEEFPKAIDLEGMNILLVEDNELNREIAIDILSEYKIKCDVAEDGDIAVEKIKNSNPGQYKLVLMDVQMPRMNGYEATRAIRSLEDKELANIPIVAMTANAFEEDRQNALKAGMNGHLAKPINIPKLVDTLSEFNRNAN